MTAVIWACGIILAVATIGTLYRLWTGPTLLDRVVSSDVLLTIIAAGICLLVFAYDRYIYLPILVVLSMIGFISSVTVARFASNAPVNAEIDRVTEVDQKDVEKNLETGSEEG